LPAGGAPSAPAGSRPPPPPRSASPAPGADGERKAPPPPRSASPAPGADGASKPPPPPRAASPAPGADGERKAPPPPRAGSPAGDRPAPPPRAAPAPSDEDRKKEEADKLKEEEEAKKKKEEEDAKKKEEEAKKKKEEEEAKKKKEEEEEAKKKKEEEEEAKKKEEGEAKKKEDEAKKKKEEEEAKKKEEEEAKKKEEETKKKKEEEAKKKEEEEAKKKEEEAKKKKEEEEAKKKEEEEKAKKEKEEKAKKEEEEAAAKKEAEEKAKQEEEEKAKKEEEEKKGATGKPPALSSPSSLSGPPRPAVPGGLTRPPGPGAAPGLAGPGGLTRPPGPGAAPGPAGPGGLTRPPGPGAAPGPAGPGGPARPPGPGAAKTDAKPDAATSIVDPEDAKEEKADAKKDGEETKKDDEAAKKDGEAAKKDGEEIKKAEGDDAAAPIDALTMPPAPPKPADSDALVVAPEAALATAASLGADLADAPREVLVQRIAVQHELLQKAEAALRVATSRAQAAEQERAETLRAVVAVVGRDTLLDRVERFKLGLDAPHPSFPLLADQQQSMHPLLQLQDQRSLTPRRAMSPGAGRASRHHAHHGYDDEPSGRHGRAEARASPSSRVIKGSEASPSARSRAAAAVAAAATSSARATRPQTTNGSDSPLLSPAAAPDSPSNGSTTGSVGPARKYDRAALAARSRVVSSQPARAFDSMDSAGASPYSQTYGYQNSRADAIAAAYSRPRPVLSFQQQQAYGASGYVPMSPGYGAYGQQPAMQMSMGPGYGGYGAAPYGAPMQQMPQMQQMPMYSPAPAAYPMASAHPEYTNDSFSHAVASLQEAAEGRIPPSYTATMAASGRLPVPTPAPVVAPAPAPAPAPGPAPAPASAQTTEQQIRHLLKLYESGAYNNIPSMGDTSLLASTAPAKEATLADLAAPTPTVDAAQQSSVQAAVTQLAAAASNDPMGFVQSLQSLANGGKKEANMKDTASAAVAGALAALAHQQQAQAAAASPRIAYAAAQPFAQAYPAAGGGYVLVQQQPSATFGPASPRPAELGSAAGATQVAGIDVQDVISRALASVFGTPQVQQSAQPMYLPVSTGSDFASRTLPMVMSVAPAVSSVASAASPQQMQQQGRVYGGARLAHLTADLLNLDDQLAAEHHSFVSEAQGATAYKARTAAAGSPRQLPYTTSASNAAALPVSPNGRTPGSVATASMLQQRAASDAAEINKVLAKVDALVSQATANAKQAAEKAAKSQAPTWTAAGPSGMAAQPPPPPAMAAAPAAVDTSFSRMFDLPPAPFSTPAGGAAMPARGNVLSSGSSASMTPGGGRVDYRSIAQKAQHSVFGGGNEINSRPQHFY
jgi:hypothetical protein